jgi:Hint domain
MTAPVRTWGDAALARAWIGAPTPVGTCRGPVEARHIRPGDLVETLEGPTRVLSVGRAGLPLDTRSAPVLLRAPYFAARGDLLVSPGQPVVLRGAVVEYLFGEDVVQAEARLLVDGQRALSVDDGTVVGAVSLVLDRAGAILADGCALAMPGQRGDALRSLCTYEVAAFLSHRWGGSLGHAA